MPLVSIQTSLESIENAEPFLKELSSNLSNLIGKPESYVMTILNTSVSMTHAGTLDPACYVEVKSIGEINNESTKKLSAAICGHIESRMGVPANRIYIEFKDVPANLWGWNNTTFG